MQSFGELLITATHAAASGATRQPPAARGLHPIVLVTFLLSELVS